MKRILLLGLAMMSAGVLWRCDPANDGPAALCDDLRFVVAPGMCVRFANPCGGRWLTPTDNGVETFWFVNPPLSTSVLAVGSAEGVTSRYVCAADNAPLSDTTVDYRYDSFKPFHGGGTAHITVEPPLILRVSATPDRIREGESSQLAAVVSGGFAPGGAASYRFEWLPSDSVAPPDDPRPTATPRETTRYFVAVTDSANVSQTAEVVVTVDPTIPIEVTATATPSTIDQGQTSQLVAVVIDGSGPYDYVWTPTNGLTNAAIRNPVASPVVSTDYNVSVVDGQGNQGSAHVLVTVKPVGALVASFTFVRGAFNPGTGTTHWTFDASASTGPIARYRWDLTGNDGTMIPSESAAPVLELDLKEGAQKGSMTLTVSAADGRSATLTLPYR